ncbi:hypothetical protein D3C73_1583210 [compost metagenome]
MPMASVSEVSGLSLLQGSAAEAVPKLSVVMAWLMVPLLVMVLAPCPCIPNAP